MFHSVSLLSQAPLARGSCALPSVLLVHAVKLKPIIKAQISGKLVTSGISDVATASVHSEKTWAKKWIMNKSQELSVFHGRQKLTSAKN